MRSIKEHRHDFKKSLKIEFVNEPGVDGGGLKKEWFLLLTKELFDPSKKLFSYYNPSNLCMLRHLNYQQKFMFNGVRFLLMDPFSVLSPSF